MESFLIDFGKEFMPASWQEFNRYFIKGFGSMTYIWAPEIWLQLSIGGRDAEHLCHIVTQLKRVENIDSWFPTYVKDLTKRKIPGWTNFIDKAMVYQIINGIFYWLSSPNFDNRDSHWFVPILNSPIRFNSEIEQTFLDKPGLKNLFIEMLTINPNNRPTLEEVQNKLVNLGFSKTDWKFKPNEEKFW